VDDDVRVGQRVLDGLLHRIGGRMALADRGPRRDADHDVGEVAAGGLAEPQAPQLDRRVHACDRPARGLLRLVRRPVHEDVHVRPDQPCGRQQHEDGDEEGRERVGAGVAGGDECQPEQNRERPGEITREVERVRLERGALVPARPLKRDPGAARIDGDHDPDHEEGVPGRLDAGIRGSDEMRHGPVRDEEAREHEDRRLGESSEMLRPTVSVGVSRIGRPSGDADGEEGQKRGDEIRTGVDRLGDEPEAAARQARTELQPDQHERRKDGDEGCSALRAHR
jgi:hypothetical protein